MNKFIIHLEYAHNLNNNYTVVFKTVSENLALKNIYS